MPRRQREPKTKGLYVKVYNNNIDKALSKFKQKVKDSELLLEIRERAHYTKKSTKRRHMKKIAILRAKYQKMREN